MLTAFHLNTVGLVGETREAPIPIAQRFQIADVRSVRTACIFAGHHHRDAGWIGDDAGRNDPIRQFVELHPLQLIAYQRAIRLCRQHPRRRQGGESTRKVVGYGAIAKLVDLEASARKARERNGQQAKRVRSLWWPDSFAAVDRMKLPRTFKPGTRVDADDWSVHGVKITAPAFLEAIRKVLNEHSGPVLLEHRFLRGARGPDHVVFNDFEDLVEYGVPPTRRATASSW